MVQRYDMDFDGRPYSDQDGEWVKYEDYAKLVTSVQACVAVIKEGSLAVEHVQGYLEGVVEVLDGH